ncbi:phosphohistidine phosphatase SixA [Filimonas lacunae]|nr:phosphohistidine phosphatase SixA [Filimonas lacunae]
MAQRLLNRVPYIDAFVSSSARRAITTAGYFAEAYGIKEADIYQVQALYHAPAATFYKTIAELQDSWNSVIIFSHNPGITDFINTLTQVHLDNMPTCGVFAISVAITSWSEFADADKHFLFFDYPKLDV